MHYNIVISSSYVQVFLRMEQTYKSTKDIIDRLYQKEVVNYGSRT